MRSVHIASFLGEMGMARCTACAVFGSRSLGLNLPVLEDALPCSSLTPRGGPGVCSNGLISAS